MALEPMFRVKDLAVRLTVSERQVARWIEQGELTAVHMKVGTKTKGTILIPESSVLAMLKRHAPDYVPPAAPEPAAAEVVEMPRARHAGGRHG